MIAAQLALVLAVLDGGPRVPDTVELVDGTRLAGRVVYEDAQVLVLATGKRERQLRREDVRSLDSRAARHRAAMLTWIGLPADDLDGLLELAERCKREDLLEEMGLFALQALVLDQGCGRARRMLGHEETPRGWMVPDGKRRIEWTRLLEARRDFATPWELESTHYRVRTNVPLNRAVEAALTLECHYLALRDALGRELRLREVLEPLRASIHGDRTSFPEIATGRRAFYVAGERTLYVDASLLLEVRALLHEATHAVLHATAIAEGKGKAVVPAWLDEGLAIYMETALVGTPARLVYDLPAAGSHWYRIHADAKAPYDLSRLLSFESGDFLASTRSDLKYAQAYTLVDYLVHGEGGRHREGLSSFVRGAYGGQSSQKHFKSAIGVDERALERAWTEHVRARAR